MKGVTIASRSARSTGAGKPIALMGGGTTRVGDPSGKDETRKILPIEQIEANKAGIQQVFARFLKFGAGKADAVMADNAEWLTRLNYIEMLRGIVLRGADFIDLIPQVFALTTCCVIILTLSIGRFRKQLG